MTESDPFEESIQRLLQDFVQLDGATRTLFAYPASCEPLASDFLKVASRHCVASAADSCESFSELSDKLLESDVIVFLENASSTYSKELREFLLAHNDKRAYRLFDFSRDLLLNCFNCDRQTLGTLNQSLIARGSSTSVVTVKSEAGTDLRIGLDKKFGWVNSLGRYVVGRPGILPPSEVATFSAQVDGVLIADGAVNYNLGVDFDPRLRGRPISVELEGSRVVSARCGDPFIRRLLEIFFSVQHSDRVGEIGFGTNIGLANFVPFVSHINERYPGFHLGLGSNNQGEKLAGWQCLAHLDLILDACEIWFDDVLVHSGRTYCLENRLDVSPGVQVIDHDTF